MADVVKFPPADRRRYCVSTISSVQIDAYHATKFNMTLQDERWPSGGEDELPRVDLSVTFFDPAVTQVSRVGRFDVIASSQTLFVSTVGAFFVKQSKQIDSLLKAHSEDDPESDLPDYSHYVFETGTETVEVISEHPPKFLFASDELAEKVLSNAH